MKLLVVRTPDGDVYFTANREGTDKAIAFASEMVIGCNGIYDQEDSQAIHNLAQLDTNRAGKPHKTLYAQLVYIGAIKERETQ